jgi:hypothetical protein
MDPIIFYQESDIVNLTIPIGSMYAIYGNMDPINILTPNVSIYSSTMDPIGYNIMGISSTRQRLLGLLMESAESKLNF